MGTDVEDLTASLEQAISEEVLGVEVEQDEETALIAKPFDPDKIKVSTEKKTVDLLNRRIAHKEIDLAPDFQRRARLWHPHKKSQLIESLLLRIPLPVFYVAADPLDNWTVVDGLQRLTTIYDFMQDAFPLAGLEYLKQFEGTKFQNLDRAMKRRIEETELVINVIQPGTPEEVMINIFKRINTGGVPLNGQEIRNALNKGPVRTFLRELAASPAFREATDHRVRDDRMDGQEMLLRFLAFRIHNWRDYTENDLDNFLNGAMQRLNRMTEQERTAWQADVERAMKASRAIFEGDAFRKRYNIDDARNPVSKALFEAWGVSLAARSDEELAILIRQREKVRNRFMAVMRDDREFDASISLSTGVPKRITKRFDTIEKLIGQVLIEEMMQ